MSDEAYFIQANETILLKKAIARKLYKKNFEQSRISEILCLSQPMVSNYCKDNEKLPDYILDFADKISEKINNDSDINFHTCISFSKKIFEGKFFIAKQNEMLTEDTHYIVNNLTEAFFLIKGRNIKKLLPEVKINIAMAKNYARNSDEVAAFINGIIVVDNRISNINGVRFGTSKHLSSMLLYLKDYLNIKSIMNIAFIDDIDKYGFHYSYLTNDFKLNLEKEKIDILLHKGDFGIEPCAYIVGENAVDVAKKLIRLLDVI